MWAGAGFTVGARLGVWLWRLLVLAAIVGCGIVMGVAAVITQSVPAERRIPLTIALLGITVLSALGYRWLTSQSWGRTVLYTAGAIVALAGAVFAVRGI